MKRSTPDHPKTRRLMRRLNVPLWGACGILEALWHFTARFARRGDIGRFNDQEIADAIGWIDEPAQLVDALVECGWLDRCSTHRLVIHDWKDHADDSVRKTLKKHGEQFACEAFANDSGTGPTDSACLSLSHSQSHALAKPEDSVASATGDAAFAARSAGAESEARGEASPAPSRGGKRRAGTPAPAARGKRRAASVPPAGDERSAAPPVSPRASVEATPVPAAGDESSAAPAPLAGGENSARMAPAVGGESSTAPAPPAGRKRDGGPPGAAAGKRSAAPPARRAAGKRNGATTAPAGGESSAGQPEPTGAKEPSAHQSLVAFWCQRWGEAHDGKYPFRGRDGQHVRDLLRHADGSLDTAKAIVERYLADGDRFYAGHPLGRLIGDLPKFVAGGSGASAADGTGCVPTRELSEAEADRLLASVGGGAVP